jgi:hypothetical protein
MPTFFGQFFGTLGGHSVSRHICRSRKKKSCQAHTSASISKACKLCEANK